MMPSGKEQKTTNMSLNGCFIGKDAVNSLIKSCESFMNEKFCFFKDIDNNRDDIVHEELYSIKNIELITKISP